MRKLIFTVVSAAVALIGITLIAINAGVVGNEIEGALAAEGSDDAQLENIWQLREKAAAAQKTWLDATKHGKLFSYVYPNRDRSVKDAELYVETAWLTQYIMDGDFSGKEAISREVAAQALARAHYKSYLEARVELSRAVEAYLSSKLP